MHTVNQNFVHTGIKVLPKTLLTMTIRLSVVGPKASRDSDSSVGRL